MLLAFSPPTDNIRGPQHVHQALGVLHRLCTRSQPLTLLIASEQTAGLYCRVPDALARIVENQLHTEYSGCTIRRRDDRALDPPDGWEQWIEHVVLRPDLFPILRYPQFIDPAHQSHPDPIGSLLEAVAPSPEDLRASIAFTVRPATSARVRRTQRAARSLTHPMLRSYPLRRRLFALAATNRHLLPRVFARLIAIPLAYCTTDRSDSALTTTASRTHDREQDLVAVGDKLGRHLFEVTLTLRVAAPSDAHHEARQKLRELAAALNKFAIPRFGTFRRVRRTQRGFLLSDQELATLWHLPTADVRTTRLERTLSRELEAPANVPLRETEADLSELGRLQFRDNRNVFGIRLDDRRRHLTIAGKTGMGKSTLMHRLLASDIQAGRGVCLIDPHGDLAESILREIPRHRTNDVVLFDAGDRAFPPAFNPFDLINAEQRPLASAGIVASFKKLYSDSWGPRLEFILRNAVLALLETPGATLLSLSRLLVDIRFREALLQQLADPIIRTFWLQEFPTWSERYRTEAIAPIQNKVGQFIAHPVLRSILCQQRNKLDLRRVMDAGQILIVNLSKGRIGEDASALLGSLLVTNLQLAAMSRATIPEESRADFFAYVDEFQNFATESFATILSEARKYRLSLTLAHQYLTQLDDLTREAVFGNVGSLLCFNVGPSDAAVFSEQLGGDLRPLDLVMLPKFTAYVRLLIDGQPSRPFSMTTLPVVPRTDTQRAEVVRRTSRNRYCQSAADVEARLRKQFSAV